MRECAARALAAWESHPFQAFATQLVPGALELTPAALGWVQYERARASLPPGEGRGLDRLSQLAGQCQTLKLALGARQRYRSTLDVWWTVRARLAETGLIVGAPRILDAIFAGRFS